MITTGRISLGVVEEWGCECYGRNSKKEQVFDIPVHMNISISKLGSTLSVDVHCPYMPKGGCNASHPHINNISVSCPYRFDLPIGKEYLKSHKKDRTSVNKDLARIASEKDSLLHPWKHLFE